MYDKPLRHPPPPPPPPEKTYPSPTSDAHQIENIVFIAEQEEKSKWLQRKGI